jgi:hypothetical protein
MARNRGGNASEATEVTETAAATEEKVDGRYKKVTDPETGEVVNRVEYIRKLCAPPPEGKGMSRSEATKHLRELTGEQIRYQIIFAATKNMKGIKASARGKKTEATEEAAAE